jgi:hypothetical protein
MMDLAEKNPWYAAGQRQMLISFEAITKGTNVSSVPKGTYFFLFKINALDKFGDSCWFTLVYNNVSPNGLYQNLVLPAKVTDRFGMLAPLDDVGS